jgi:hypothetical protein
MSRNISPVGTRLFKTLYAFYETRKRDRYLAYTIIAVIALAYAMYMDQSLERPKANVAYECAILTVLLLLAMPFVFQTIEKYKLEETLVKSQKIILAAITFILLAGTAYFTIKTVSTLQSRVKELEQTQNAATDRSAKKLRIGQSTPMFQSDLTIKLVDIKLDSQGTYIAKTILSSPENESPMVSIKEGQSISFTAGQGKERVINAVKIESDSALFFAAKVK